MAKCFDDDMKEFPFTQDEVNAIWKYAKDTHIDNLDKTPEQVYQAVADELGLKPEWVAKAFTLPKSVKRVTDDMYRKQYERRSTIKAAKDYVSDLNTPPGYKALRKLYDLPRQLLTWGHFTVFPETHAGDLKYHPTMWNNYIETVVNTWRSISPAYSQRILNEMQAHPLYNVALRAGLDISPESTGKGILIGKTGVSARGWDALKPTRLKLFEARWNALDTELRTPEGAKTIARELDFLTGTLPPGHPGFGALNKILFAPSLTYGKWARITEQPARTASTFYRMATGKGEAVSATERQLAYDRLRAATGYIATRYMGLLALNQAVLSATGSDQKINIFDPHKSDWLRPKGFGHVLNPRGAGEAIQLLGNVIAAGYTTKQTAGKSPAEASRNALARYVQYKLNPSVQVPIEIATGHDTFGRPYPWSKDAGTANKPRYNWYEFFTSLGPIPLQGAMKEIYESLDFAGHVGSETIMKGMAAGAMELFGGSVYEEKPYIKPIRQSQRVAEVEQ